MAFTGKINQQLTTDIKNSAAIIDQIRQELSKTVVGQQHMIDRLLIGLLTNGHILLEGVPGLAKTLTIKSLAQTIDASFSRIQFTPDLLPADVTGTMIYQQQENKFYVRKGPIFAQFVLADEINRAPAKVQSALLEAMQEHQVTIGEHSYRLDEPFLVLATQNPLEQEGTYPLPEAQQDRFLLKVKIGYPSRQEEQLILRRQSGAQTEFPIIPVVKTSQITEAKKLVRQIYLDEQIEEYILDLTEATRNPEKAGLPTLKPFIQYGGSPRAVISLALASKAMAYLKKRSYVLPEDVQNVARDVLRHRIGLTYEAAAENVSVDDILDKLITQIRVR
jgi:MoxR-like ATPase